MKSGTLVRMSACLKDKLNSNGCEDHVKEFGDCAGVVIGFITYKNGTIGPEVDVRWMPSGLKYAYNPEDLYEASDAEAIRTLLDYAASI